ncbi:hypothetical protein Tco_0264700 [Tanacetum coccineum]
MVFYQMKTEEVSDRFVAPCFINGLEAYDGEINLGVEENMISNEYAVKLGLEHEVKRGNKVVKKELIIALKGEIYFVKFIINPEEDDVEPRVIFGRSFLRMTKGITNFGAGTIYPDIDPFLEETKEEENSNDDWDHLLDFNIDDVLLLGEKGLPLFNEPKVALLEEEGPIIETMAYHDKYKKILDEVWKYKVELDGKIIKEEEEGVKRIKGREDMKKVGITTLIAKFLILDIAIDHDSPIVVGRGFMHIMRNAESDSDYEEDYQIKRNKFGAPIYGPKPAPYLNCNDPAERSLAIQTVTNPFRKISVWKKEVSFLGSLPVPLKNVNWKPDYKGSLWEHTMVRLDHHDPNALDNMKPWKRMGCDGEIDNMLRIRLRKVGSDEEILTSTYEFDEVCADDELQTKKIIKFRLGVRAHSLTLLEFARRLGLYQAVELEEEGFNVYFEGGLRSDEYFNAQDYWLSIRREENLDLSRSHTSTIRNSILRTPEWVCECGLVDCKMDEKERSWHSERKSNSSSLARGLDTITLRDLIDSKGKLIPEDPQPGVPRVGIPRPPRASIQDLYDKMGRMEIRQEAIEQMEYRQSYH